MTAATLWLLIHAGILRIIDSKMKNAPSVALDFEVEIADAPSSQGTPQPPPVAEVPNQGPETAAPASNPKADALRQEITELGGQVGDLDHYSALGLSTEASTVQIKKAYFKAAKRYHPDSLAKLNLSLIHI